MPFPDSYESVQAKVAVSALVVLEWREMAVCAFLSPIARGLKWTVLDRILGLGAISLDKVQMLTIAKV